MTSACECRRYSVTSAATFFGSGMVRSPISRKGAKERQGRGKKGAAPTCELLHRRSTSFPLSFLCAFAPLREILLLSPVQLREPHGIPRRRALVRDAHVARRHA